MAGVGDLSGDERAGQRDAGDRVIRAPVLFAAEQNVAAGSADHIGKMATVFGEEGDGDSGVGAGAQKEGAAGDVSEAHDAAKIKEGEAQSDFLLDLDNDGLAFLAEISALGGNVEGIEEAEHGAVSR